MGIESNKEAVAMMKNALGSIENRFREAYNKGYKDGIKEGINQAMQKIADSILEEVEAEPQTKPPCDTRANKGDHDGECSNCVSDPETIRWKTPSHYKPKDESQTCSFSDCDNFKNPDYARCIECKRKQIKSKVEPQAGEMMTEEEFDSMLARVLTGNAEPQTDCAWKNECK